MAAKGTLPLYFKLKLLCFLIHINPSLAYSLKNCTIIYQETQSADVCLDCANRKLVTIPDDLPKDAVSIQLFKNLLQKITKEDFQDMSKLRTLNLRSNHIAYVDDGSFIDLGSLKTFNMQSNQLTNLTSNMFQGLSNLTMLDLSYNEIQFIHASAFQFLISLETLTLKENQIQKISDVQPVLQLPHLRTLSLSCNQYPSFETKNLLQNVNSNLRELSVAGVNLEKFSITTPVFPYIQKLDLSACGCHPRLKWDIPDKTLLMNITQLYFEESVLTFEDIQHVLHNLDSLRHLRINLVDEWFKQGLLSSICQIATLRRLDLSKNSLDDLTIQLVPCSQLNELDLSINGITKLPKGTIQSMKQLRSLNVSHNLLASVPHDIRSCSFLKILDLNSNRILELTCEDFANTTLLSELYLNNNRIAKLDRCVVENLTDLKVLNLSHNLLRKFGDTFKVALRKLEILDMSYTSVSSLRTHYFQGLESLKQLKTGLYFFDRVKHRWNSLEDEPHSKGLQNLETFTIIVTDEITFNILFSNSLNDYIPLKSLKILTLSCKEDHPGLPFNIPEDLLQSMEHLQDFTAVNMYAFPPDVSTFKSNSELKSLKLARTDLSNLNPEFFLPIPNLLSLDFSESHIRSLDFLMQANLTLLKYLKLADNELTVINETVFESLPTLRYLDLSNNPFTCDCSNAGFIKWAKNNKQTQVANTHYYVCSFPLDKRGSFLLDFDIQPCWNDGSFFFFISSTCLVFLTLLTSFIYHFLRWHLVYTFHLFLAFVYDSKNRGKEDHHQFDAFVSYNVHDEDWVYGEMVPVLEGEQGWRLCLHHRDFQPGKPIIENITDAIYGSRKTICVITRHYLQSEWCSREIQMASFRLFDEQKDVLILLFLEEIPSRHLSPYYRMRKLVKKLTYLSWPQAAQHPGLFWQNVNRALQTGDDLTENTDLLTRPTGC